MGVVTNPPQWQAGEIIDGLYEVIQLAGMGGMGQVYQVRHRQWGVELAVKIPRPDALLSPGERENFVSEAEAWVSLGLHPNICCCHYVSQIGGVPMVFAEYVPGGSLQDWIDDGRLYRGPADEALLRVLDVAVQFAWGLDHAHLRGLVHQDVKPANLLIDSAGGDLTVKVTDFGLARANAGRHMIRAGSGSGVQSDVSIMVSRLGWTPAYASPEQAAAQRLSRRTDVYSYAVSVLEMFTGERLWTSGPDAGRALAGCLAAGPAQPGPPPMPSALASLLERCLRPDPAQRPDSMMEIAAEISGIYEKAASSVYPRMTPRAADLLADELANRAVSLLDLGRQADADQVFAQALAADPQNARAIYNAGLARWRCGAVTDDTLIIEIEATRADTGDPWEVRYVLAQIHLERGDLSTAREMLDALARERPNELEVSSALRMIRSGEIIDARCADEWQVPWPRRPPPRSLWVQAVDKRPDLVPLALTPDGRLMVVGGWDGAVRLYEVHAGQCVRTLKGHRRPVNAVDITPDGCFAVSAGADETVRFWELDKSRFGGSAKGRLLHASPNPPSWVGDDDMKRSGDTVVRLTDDGRLALYTDHDGAFRVWDVRTGQMRIHDQATAIRLVEVSADGRWALSVRSLRLGADREDVARLWDLRSNRCERELLPGHKPAVTALCFSPDGRYAATAGYDEIRVWDLGDGRCMHVLAGVNAPSTLSLSADARFLLSGGQYESAIRCWELDHGRCLRTFQAHQGGTTAVRLDADGRFGLSAGQDRMVRRWELPGGYRGAPLLSRPRPHVELSRLGGRLDALTSEAERATAARRFPAALDLLRQARAIEGYERAPGVMSAWWALGRRAMRTGLRAAWSSRAWHVGERTAVDLSGDGRIVVTGGRDGTIRVWDAGSGSCLRVLEGHKQMVQSVSLSADGRQLLSSSRDGEVRLWEADTGTCQQVLTVNVRMRRDDSLPVRFGAYGRQAVVLGPRGTIRLWDLHAGGLPREVRTLYGEGYREICLGDDGRLAAVIMSSGMVLWDLDRGRVVHHLDSGSALTMKAASLSADGRLALAGDYDGGLRLWDTATGAVIRTFDGPPQDGFHTIRMTADGRFAVSGGYWSYMTVWDVRSGRCIRVLDGHERGVYRLAFTPDGRFVLAEHDDHLRLWELDWDLAAQDAADWDDGAAAYLEAFLHRHGSRWTDTDVEALLRRLQDVGYGWLRADGVRAELDRRTSAHQSEGTAP